MDLREKTVRLKERLEELEGEKKKLSYWKRKERQRI